MSKPETPTRTRRALFWQYQPLLRFIYFWHNCNAHLWISLRFVESCLTAPRPLMVAIDDCHTDNNAPRQYGRRKNGSDVWCVWYVWVCGCVVQAAYIIQSDDHCTQSTTRFLTSNQLYLHAQYTENRKNMTIPRQDERNPDPDGPSSASPTKPKPKPTTTTILTYSFLNSSLNLATEWQVGIGGGIWTTGFLLCRYIEHHIAYFGPLFAGKRIM